MYVYDLGFIDLAQFVEVLRFPLWCYLAVQWVLLICENIANEGQADVYMNALDMMTHISRYVGTFFFLGPQMVCCTS